MTFRIALLLIFPLLLLGAGCSDRDAAATRDSRGDASLAPIASATATGVAGAGPAANAPSATTTAPQRAEGPAEHEGSRALAHVEYLATAIGPRVAGTAGEQRAAAYIAEQFRASGYAVETPPFEFSGDRFRAATLKAGGREFEGISMDGSVGGAVAGPAAFVGLADSAGINGRNLAGKIAVADRGTLTFAEKYEAARAAGAAGLVILNNTGGQLNGRISEGAKLPVLGVAGEDAATVRALANAGERFELIAADDGPSRGTNVIARSAAGAVCDVVVGGHYDTVPAAPGANDNASGTGNVIELARAMAADGLDNGLCFAAFSAEESGLFGSEAFVNQLRDEGHLPKAMVNMDVTGIGTGLELIGDAALVDDAIEIAKGFDIAARRSSLPANTGSDHQSFEEAGVRSIWFFSGDFPTIHSPKDVAGDIDATSLDRAGDVAKALLTRILREVARG